MTQSYDKQVHLKGISGVFHGREFNLDSDKDEITIGRLPQCDITLKEDTISSRHAKIVKGEEHFEIHDLGSTNGTFVNDEKIQQKILRTGDKVKFDIFEFEFIDPFDVPRTILATPGAPVPGSEESGKTMIRGTLPGTQPAAPDETVRLPSQPPIATPAAAASATAPSPATTRLPSPDQTIPIAVDGPTEALKSEPLKPEEIRREKVPPRPKTQEREVTVPAKSGNAFVGIFLGVLVALFVGYLGLFVGSWMKMDFATTNLDQLLLGVLNIYPLVHLHTGWIKTGVSVPMIITVVGILLGLFLGGFLTHRFSRKGRVLDSFMFSLFYLVVSITAQLAVMKFDFASFKTLYIVTGMDVAGTTINIAATIAYIFVVGFIFSLVGSLFSRD